MIKCVLVASLTGYAITRQATGTASFHATGKPGFVKVDGEQCELTGTGEESVDGKVSGTFTVKLTTCKDASFSLRQRHTQEYLETDKYADAKLTLKAWPKSAAATDFDGDLTLHGVTKPVKGKASVGEQLHAEFVVDVTQFGLEQARNLGTVVSKDVTVTVEADVK